MISVFVWAQVKTISSFQSLNNKLKLFGKVVPLEHPRYVMQYKSKSKEKYIGKYVEEFLKA